MADALESEGEQLAALNAMLARVSEMREEAETLRRELAELDGRVTKLEQAPGDAEPKS